jgi:hypothetical protein
LTRNDWVEKAHTTVAKVESILARINRSAAITPAEIVVGIDSMSHEICVLGDAAEYCRNVHADSNMVCLQ